MYNDADNEIFEDDSATLRAGYMAYKFAIDKERENVNALRTEIAKNYQKRMITEKKYENKKQQTFEIQRENTILKIILSFVFIVLVIVTSLQWRAMVHELYRLVWWSVSWFEAIRLSVNLAREEAHWSRIAKHKMKYTDYLCPEIIKCSHDVWTRESCFMGIITRLAPDIQESFTFDEWKVFVLYCINFYNR
jgi:hypothetical protein